MKGWFTLNLDEWNSVATFEQVEDFSLKPEKILPDYFEVVCSICNHKLKAKVYSGANVTEITSSCLAELVSFKHHKNYEVIKEHLSNTKSIIQTNEPFLSECDCDYRLHQLVASENYIHYISGEGYADEVQSYLQFSEELD